MQNESPSSRSLRKAASALTLQLTPAPAPHASARQAPSLLLPSSVGAPVTPGTHSHILTGTQAVTDGQGCLGVQKQVTKSYLLK